MERALISLENIYDTYSPMLFSMALDITHSKLEAEEILVQTFVKVSRLEIAEQHPIGLSVKLIKLLVQTAKESVHPKNARRNFVLKQFEKVPITHQLLVEQIGFENYCNANNITRVEAAKKIRAEMKAVREEFNVIRVNTV